MAHILHTPFIPSSSALRCTPIVHRKTTAPLVVRARIREIFMPALSSTMTEGKIVSWTKSEGDKLSKGDSVVVVESDKADMDVETFYDGYLAAIVVEEGGVAAVGSPIAFLAETKDEIPQAKSRASSLLFLFLSRSRTGTGAGISTGKGCGAARLRWRWLRLLRPVILLQREGRGLLRHLMRRSSPRS
ncbi:Dihydrolipoyllysine-residue acetyltransferase [Spatholobus suberectus]|nr:Dihydrolipoyllysine-residue acetyltransferase [Spatholobus suberectus]